jgi:hypothetical protein
MALIGDGSATLWTVAERLIDEGDAKGYIGAAGED